MVCAQALVVPSESRPSEPIALSSAHPARTPQNFQLPTILARQSESQFDVSQMRQASPHDHVTLRRIVGALDSRQAVRSLSGSATGFCAVGLLSCLQPNDPTSRFPVARVDPLRYTSRTLSLTLNCKSPPLHSSSPSLHLHRIAVSRGCGRSVRRARF